MKACVLLCFLAVISYAYAHPTVQRDDNKPVDDLSKPDEKQPDRTSEPNSDGQKSPQKRQADIPPNNNNGEEAKPADKNGKSDGDKSGKKEEKSDTPEPRPKRQFSANGEAQKEDKKAEKSGGNSEPPKAQEGNKLEEKKEDLKGLKVEKSEGQDPTKTNKP